MRSVEHRSSLIMFQDLCILEYPFFAIDIYFNIFFFATQTTKRRTQKKKKNLKIFCNAYVMLAVPNPNPIKTIDQMNIPSASPLFERNKDLFVSFTDRRSKNMMYLLDSLYPYRNLS